MRKFIALSAAMILITACKRNYTCECVNPGGKSVVVIHDTYRKAREQCKGPDIPMSETSCTLR